MCREAICSIQYQRRAAIQSATLAECSLTSPAPSAICIRPTSFIATSNQKTSWSVDQLSRVIRSSSSLCFDCAQCQMNGSSLISIEWFCRNRSKMNCAIHIHFQILTKKERWKCVSRNLNMFKWLNCYRLIVVFCFFSPFSFSEFLESVEIRGKNRHFIRFASDRFYYVNSIIFRTNPNIHNPTQL